MNKEIKETFIEETVSIRKDGVEIVDEYASDVLECLDKALTSQKAKFKEVVEGKLEQGTGINAIPTVGDFSDGWNDCRKTAFRKRKITLQDILKEIDNI